MVSLALITTLIVLLVVSVLGYAVFNNMITIPGIPSVINTENNSTTPSPYDFSISLNSTSGTIERGSAISTTLSTSVIRGTVPSVTFTCDNFQPGTVCSFNPTSCTPPCVSTLTID